MNSELLPTKRNLMLAKRNLEFASQGHDLLDKKYKVLLRALSAVKFSVDQLRHQLDDALENAKKMVAIAQMEVGDKSLKKIINSQPLDASIQISYHSIMGAIIPKIKYDNKKHTTPPYSLCGSTVSLDDAFFAWQSVKFLLIKLIEAEIAVQHVNAQLQKAKKRAAALENIIIPTYKSRIKYISNQLEEKERDELIRIKKHCVSI